jgi:hypothetical protein
LSKQSKTAHQLFIEFKKAHDSFRREELYNILIEFEVLMKIVKLIKMCLDESHSEACKCIYLSDNLVIKYGLKQGDALLPLLLSFAS